MGTFSWSSCWKRKTNSRVISPLYYWGDLNSIARRPESTQARLWNSGQMSPEVQTGVDLSVALKKNLYPSKEFLKNYIFIYQDKCILFFVVNAESCIFKICFYQSSTCVRQTYISLLLIIINNCVLCKQTYWPSKKIVFTSSELYRNSWSWHYWHFCTTSNHLQEVTNQKMTSWM